MSTKALSTRRGFFWKAGAALSAPLAAAGAAASAAETGAEAEARLTRLEDENAIRALHQALAARINAGARGAAAELFLNPARAALDERVRGLASERFGEHDVIEVAEDGATAAARIYCTVHSEMPIEPDCTLAQMARAQGEGVLRCVERRVLEAAYVKRGGVWRIDSLTYRQA